MGLRLCVLASGSSGNCTFVASETTRLLIDAGLSGKETARRLDAIEEVLEGLHGLCLTHEHDDHRAGLRVLQRRIGVKVFANAATAEAVSRTGKAEGVDWTIFTTGAPFTIGDLSLEPFSVPHDSYDPVGFIISQGDLRVGVVSDMGMATTLIRERLKRCTAVVLEANHDEQLLKDSRRPWSLKQRIAGRQGHFSNAQAAELVAELATGDLRTVYLAHLSDECNRPELARCTVEQALTARGITHVDVKLTFPKTVSEMTHLGA